MHVGEEVFYNENHLYNVFILVLVFACMCSVFAAFITGLLQNIGTHVDPIILIQRIREGMEIPGLRDSLVKILQDYNLQVGKH